MVSVIIPVFNEGKYISKCIESILEQDYPKDDLEVLMVDGMSSDQTRSIISSFAEKYPFIHLLDNPNRIVPYAMNIGIRAAKGEILIRLDGHASYPENYISELVRWHGLLPDAWDIGGVCETRVVNSNTVSESIAKVMSDKFGVGNSAFRTGVNADYIEADTVPFGSYKSFVFDKIGLYNEKLARVQDIELNKRIKRAGGKIYLVPTIHCVYIPRDNYKDFFLNRYKTGYWVIKTCFITKTVKNLGLRHFIPACFVLALILPLLIGLIWWKPFMLVSAFVALLYSVLMLMRSIRINDSRTSVWALFKAFCCIHISYGIGSLVALFNGIFCKQ